MLYVVLCIFIACFKKQEAKKREKMNIQISDTAANRIAYLLGQENSSSKVDRNLYVKWDSIKGSAFRKKPQN